MQLSCIKLYSMTGNKKVIADLRTRGMRATPIRLSIISMLRRSTTPLSTRQILATLSGQPHKTTVYRETETLTRAGLLRGIDAGDGIKRYESTAREHHHHVICTKCRSIADLPATDCMHELRRARRTGFFVKDHDVQIFGLCANCK